MLVGALDEQGRATFVTGELHPEDLRTGTATGKVYLPGLERGELDPLRARRGHLLAKLFGGRGSDRGNLVWLREEVNNSSYKTLFENPVRAALEKGENVRFSIEPHFQPGEAAPYAVEGLGGKRKWDPRSASIHLGPGPERRPDAVRPDAEDPVINGFPAGAQWTPLDRAR